MKPIWGKIGILAILFVAVIAIVGQKHQQASISTMKPATKTLPKLVDVGSTHCIPCQMMVPVLAQLSAEYKGKLAVKFLNVNDNPDAAVQLGVDTIPTQIFYDQNGKEVARHIGFLPEEDIVSTFAQQGIILKK